jgi:hypothetical protein
MRRHPRKEPIGNIPPADAEANFYAVLETEPMAAQLTKISLRQTRHGSMAFRSDDLRRHKAVQKSPKCTDFQNKFLC